MPRPNKPRTLTAERELTARIVQLRDQRNWSNETLAAKVTEAGCSISHSAIYKIEKGEPPRRITVNELVGFARAFGMTTSDLLLGLSVAKLSRVMTEQTTALERLYRSREVIDAELEQLHTRAESLEKDLQQIEHDRAYSIGVLGKDVVRDAESLETYSEWIDAEFNNWPTFVQWAEIDQIIDKGRKGA